MNRKTEKQDIRKLSQEQLSGFFEKSGVKPFKGKQAWQWLWQKHVLDFEEMTNLSKDERNLLNDHFFISPAKLNEIKTSKDKTIKVSFLLQDGKMVEGVLIPDGSRVTACISSQVGCAYGCSFCATGQMGFVRNLDYAEIFDQVALLGKLSQERYNTGLSNIVLMGMGEPLANYDNVLQAIDLITHKSALAMSPSRVTLSTAGIVSGINKLAKDKVRFNLAVSLHTADNEKRDRLMPVNRKNNLQDLADSLKSFYQATGSRITIEYLLIDNFNDSPPDALALAKYCKKFPAKINIIEYNQVEGSPFRKPPPQKTKVFVEALEKLNMIVNIRKSRGSDIDGACGQLVIKTGLQ